MPRLGERHQGLQDDWGGPAKRLLFGPLTSADLSSAPVLQVLYDAGGGGEPEDVTDEALPAGHETDGNQFVFTEDGKWQYNLATRNYSAPGTYHLSMVSGDDEEYEISPTCQASFVVQ